jgi:hypothetical protein
LVGDRILENWLQMTSTVVERPREKKVATTLIPSRETPSQWPLSTWKATAPVQCPLVGGAMDSQGQPMSQLQYSTYRPSIDHG